MDYEESKQILLRDLRALENFDGVMYEMCGKKYSPVELAMEVEMETKIGRNMIQTHARTVEKIMKIKANQPPKKWWQFWK